MSDKVPKPRIGYYKALLGYEKLNLEQIVGYFLEWVSCVEYMIFRRENIHTWEKEYKAVKSAKRGNDVYAWKVRKGLNYLKKLPDYTFFNFKDRGRRQSSRAIFVTLTCRRDLSLDEAWERIGSDYNRWITGLRKQYGKIDARAIRAKR